MSKLFRPGISKVYVLPAVAGVSPTRPEITAGTDISLHIAAMPGFTVENQQLEVANLAERFVGSIDGPDKAAGPKLTCWDDDSVTTVRTILAKGTTTNLLLMPYGDVATKRCEVWRIKVTGLNDQEWSMSDPARFDVQCAVLSSPTQTGVIPA